MQNGYLNKTVFVGMLTDKSMESSSIDLKQPCIELEIANTNKSVLKYIPVRVLLSKNAHARSVIGMNPGEIFQVSGVIHNSSSEDDFNGIYVECCQITKILDKKAIPSTIRGRMELLNWSESNMTVFFGEVEEKDNDFYYIRVQRDHLQKGDLSKTDIIPIKTKESLDIGDHVVCMGDIYEDYIYVNALQK